MPKPNFQAAEQGARKAYLAPFARELRSLITETVGETLTGWARRKDNPVSVSADAVVKHSAAKVEPTIPMLIAYAMILRDRDGVTIDGRSIHPYYFVKLICDAVYRQYMQDIYSKSEKEIDRELQGESLDRSELPKGADLTIHAHPDQVGVVFDRLTLPDKLEAISKLLPEIQFAIDLERAPNQLAQISLIVGRVLKQRSTPAILEQASQVPAEKLKAIAAGTWEDPKLTTLTKSELGHFCGYFQDPDGNLNSFEYFGILGQKNKFK